MNRTRTWLIFVAALLGLLGLFLIYRYYPGQNQSLDPQAREAIEKAKAR